MKTFFKLKVFLFLFSVRGTRCRLFGGRLLTDTFLSRKNSKCESGKESTAVRYFSLIAVAAAVSPPNMKRRQRLFLKKRYRAFHFWSQTAAAALSVEGDCKNNFSLVESRSVSRTETWGWGGFHPKDILFEKMHSLRSLSQTRESQFAAIKKESICTN